MKRRNMKLAALAGVFGLLLSGCGAGSESASPTKAGNTTLSVSVWNYAGTPEFKALFDAFQVANPSIKIKPVDIGAADYETKVTTMLAGGDTTDVLTVKNVTDYAQYSSRGQILDLTDLVGSMDTSKLAGLDAFNVKEKYYAVPYRQDFWLLYYNKKLFKDAGIAYPQNLTWAEYAALAKKLTKTVAGKTVHGTYQHTWRSVVQAISAAQTGGNLIGGDYSFLKGQYEMSLALQKAGAMMPFATATSQKSTYQSVFETGDTAMLPMGTWYIAALLASKKAGTTNVDWGLAPMPQLTTTKDAVTFGSPTAFAVNKKATNVDAAKKFIQFAAGEKGANAIAAIGVVPALKSDAIMKSYFAVDGMPSDPASKVAFAPAKVVLEMPVSEFSAGVETILNEEHQLIMTGQKSLDEGIKEMDKRVKDEVLSQ